MEREAGGGALCGVSAGGGGLQAMAGVDCRRWRWTAANGSAHLDKGKSGAQGGRRRFRTLRENGTARSGRPPGSRVEPCEARGSSVHELISSGKLREAPGSSGKLWEALGSSGKLWEALGLAEGWERPAAGVESSKSVGERERCAEGMIAVRSHKFEPSPAHRSRRWACAPPRADRHQGGRYRRRPRWGAGWRS